jgi:hypothetical protein
LQVIAFNMLWHLLSLLVNLIISTSAQSSPQCRTIPGEKEWPIATEWQSFNKSVGGTLIHAPPLAEVCFEGTPSFNSTACNLVKKNFEGEAIHIMHPTSNLFQNYNNLSCLPDGPFCKKEGFPVFVVNATNVDQISKTLQFTKTHSIRLIIKNTGHDLTGR